MRKEYSRAASFRSKDDPASKIVQGPRVDVLSPVARVLKRLEEERFSSGAKPEYILVSCTVDRLSESESESACPHHGCSRFAEHCLH